MFKYILKKELLLIFRDIHALMVLFIMPALFILIMSLALKNTYSDSFETKLKVAVVSSENSDIKEFVKGLNKSKYFSASLVKKGTFDTLIYKENYDFIVMIDKNFKSQINKNAKNFEIKTFSKSNIKNEYFLYIKKIV